MSSYGALQIVVSLLFFIIAALGTVQLQKDTSTTAWNLWGLLLLCLCINHNEFMLYMFF